MKVLIAEDDFDIQLILQDFIEGCGYQTILTADGDEALAVLNGSDAPPIVVLDWGLPGKDGIEICQTIKGKYEKGLPYIILLTGRTSTQDIVTGLDAGADDYVTKPFERSELQARLNAAERFVKMNQELLTKVEELKKTLEHVKVLQGIIPICMHCHKIRNDKESWQKMEKYIEAHSEVEFSHDICPKCLYKNRK